MEPKTPEYEIKDQWLMQNGREIALLYGAGCEDKIKRILKILNNHDKLVALAKLFQSLQTELRIQESTFGYGMFIRESDWETYKERIDYVLSQIEKDGE
jgi:hypothetical protein